MSGWRGRALDMKDTPKWACPSCLVEGNGDLMWQEGISPLSHQNGKVLTQGRVIPLVLLKVSMRKEGQALGRTSPLTRISSEGMVWKGPRRGRLCRIKQGFNARGRFLSHHVEMCGTGLCYVTS